MIFLAVVPLAFLTASIVGTAMCWRYTPSSVEFHVFRAIGLLGCLAAVLFFSLNLVGMVGLATGAIDLSGLGPPLN